MTTSPTAMARAPPEPPSPVMIATIGVRSRLIRPMLRAMASAIPRSSDSGPGWAPSRRPSRRSTTAGLRDLVGHDSLGERRQEPDRAEADPRLAVLRRLAGPHEAQECGDLRPEVTPMDDPVDEAVLEQELRAL